jgi:hypothetical protein
VRLLVWRSGSIGNVFGDLRSGSRLSSLTLQATRALFPPLGSHLGLLKRLLVTGCGNGMSIAIRRKRILTFA